MGETLVELVAKIAVDTAELRKGLAQAEKDVEQSKIAKEAEKKAKEISASFKSMGIAFAAAGASITGAMGLMGKAAIDEDINIKRLAQTMKNSGVAYDDVKDSLEAVIATTQRKTGVADNEQRDILTRLILVTQDYDKALSLLPTTLDLAAAGGMNATQAATYLGKAYLELEQGAKEVTVRFGQASLKFKDMADIQNRVKGSAEELKNPLMGIKNAIDDINETVGANFIPMVKGATKWIEDISVKSQAWAKANPELSKSLTMITLGAGGILTLTGGIILLMPQITKLVAGFQAIALHAGLARMSLVAFSVSVAAALVGIGMLTYGLTYLADHEKAYNDVKIAGMRLEVQRQAFQRGEINNYKELLAAYIPMIEAYNMTSNAKAEDIAAQRNWITHAKEGLTKLNELDAAMKDSTKTVSSMADAYDPELVKAQEEVIRSSQKLQDEQLELNKRFSDLLLQVYYNESAAGKYGLTIDDVYQAMFRLGFKTEDLQKAFKMFGTDTNFTQQMLNEFGLTAEQVALVLGKLKETTDANAASYKKMGDAAQEAADKALRAAAATVPGGGYITPWGVIVGKGERALGPGEVGHRPEYIGGQGLTGKYFAKGGIVTQPTLGMVGEAGPEAIIPLNEAGSMGGVTINFTQPVFFDREDTMNRFVDMISKGIDRKQRLRFGGAYNG
jgi:hypothetical protein